MPRREVPLVAFGVGTKGNTTDGWRYLCELRNKAEVGASGVPIPGLHHTIDPESPPLVPWCAVIRHLSLQLSALAYLEARSWYEDAERWIAWGAVLHAGPGPKGSTQNVVGTN